MQSIRHNNRDDSDLHHTFKEAGSRIQFACDDTITPLADLIRAVRLNRGRKKTRAVGYAD